MTPRIKSRRTIKLGFLILSLLCFFAAVAGKTKHKAPPAVCDCQNVTVTGSRVHTTRMGTFVVVPDVLHDGHAVYINSNKEYLYFYAPIWLVGNDYTKNMAGVRSNGNGLCPTNVPSWEHYVDAKWTVVPLEVSCHRAPKKSPTKKSKQPKGSKTPKTSARSKKPEATNNGKWKLVPSHGDNEIIVVKRRGRTSEEVIMQYRKSMDRNHQVTMFDKDCDTPLPSGVVVYDSIVGAAIDDIQSITVVIDVDLVAAQEARLWAMCVKLALLGDSIGGDKSARPKTVAAHFTQVNFVVYQGMDDLTLERVAALDQEIMRLHQGSDHRLEQRAKQLAEALDLLKHRVRQNRIEDGSCSSEQVDRFAKTRQNLADLEKELATLSKDLKHAKHQAETPSSLDAEISGQASDFDDHGLVAAPQFYFKLEVCQCNFSSVTKKSSLPLCLPQVLDATSSLDLCLAVDSDEIYIKSIVALQLVQTGNGAKPFTVAPVDRHAGPQNTVVNYFGKFTSLRTKLTIGYFEPGEAADVEVKGTVTLASPNPESRMNDISVDFAIPLPINHGSPDDTQQPSTCRPSKKKRKRKRKP